MSDHPGTEVTCRDLLTGESETQTIKNDWIIICDGAYDLHHVSSYANGTAVITVKRTRPVDVEDK